MYSLLAFNNLNDEGIKSLSIGIKQSLSLEKLILGFLDFS